MDNNPKRKLSAIVFTDIVGFTELSAKNEPAALDLLNKQREILKPIVEKHEGVWLKEIGDGLLLTFNTSIEAVHCCIEVQNVSKETPDLTLRIAIHQGEVVLHGNDVVGDDVNIASRIEKYASPGGIAISGRVNASLERNPEFSTNFLGSPNLKGVSQDVKIYSIISHGLPDSVPIEKHQPEKKQKMNWNIYSITGAVLGVIGLLFWINVSVISTGIASDNEIPSLVILPFENRGDPKEDYYAYGISSDIISDITSVGQLRVASLSSVEELQKEGLKNSEIAEKLSSRYLVSGSLWKIDSIFQLSIELFDTEEEMLVTSQRWEMNWSDLSLVKGDLSKKIIEGLNIKIINELSNENTINPDAYELYLKGKNTFKNRTSIGDIKIARNLFKKALELDSNFIDAKFSLGYTYQSSERELALEHYENALTLANKFKDKKAKMDIKRAMGNIFSEQWDSDRSLTLFRDAYKISKEIGNKSSIASSMNGLGNYFWERRIGDSARFYFKKSYELRKELGDLEALASITNNIGLVHWIFDNDPDRAILDFEESISILEDLKIDRGTVQLSNLGIIYHYKGELQKSMEYYDKVLKMHRAVDNKAGIAFINYWIGLHYVSLYNYDKAMENFTTSYEMNDKLGIERWKASSLGGLIICNEYLGNKKQVKKYFDLTHDINRGLVNDIYLTVGFELMKLGNHDLANISFSEQLEIEKMKKNTNGTINTLTNIGINYFYMGNYQKALENFNASVNQNGIENLWHTVETLTFKHICERKLNLPVEDEFLRDYISKKMNEKEAWYRNEPEYINWALYEFLGENKYIIEAKRQIDSKLDKMESDDVSKFSSFPMVKRIINSYNKMENS